MGFVAVIRVWTNGACELIKDNLTLNEAQKLIMTLEHTPNIEYKIISSDKAMSFHKIYIDGQEFQR